MIDKYNNNINMNDYCDKLIGRIFKVLPLLEENPDHAKKYISSLLVELNGASKIFNDNSYFISIICSLEGIGNCTDYNLCRRKIFECISICNKLKANDGL